MSADGVHWVYKLFARRVEDDFGKDGSIEEHQLLYVGVTSDLSSRLRQHFTDKQWAPLIGLAEWHAFASRSEAEFAESTVISYDKPLFNTMHVSRLDATRKRAQEFWDERLKWIPAHFPHERAEILEMLTGDQVVAGSGLKKLRKELHAAFAKATSQGVNVSEVERLVQEMAQKESKTAAGRQKEMA